MQLHKLLWFAVTAAASPLVEPNHDSGNSCCDARCYKRLVYADSHDMGNAKKDCEAYQKVTVTPCPATKTVYTTARPRGYTGGTFVQSQVESRCTPSVCVKKQPRYADGYCTGKDWANACSCLGVKPTTVTAAQPTVTTTKCGDPKTTTESKKGTTCKGPTSSTSGSCLSTITTVTQTVTPPEVTSTMTLPGTITHTTSSYDSTITLPISSETDVFTTTVFTTVANGIVTTTIPATTVTATCFTDVDSTRTVLSTITSTTTVLTTTTNRASGIAYRWLSDAPSTCSIITKTTITTAPTPTTTVTQTPTTTVTVSLASTLTSGTSLTLTTSYTTLTVIVPITTTVTPDPMTVCLTTETSISRTIPITSTTRTTTTDTSIVTATPTTCGNQGLQWAYYQNIPGYQNENTDASYSTFNDTVIEDFKSTEPLDNGVTTSIGDFSYATGARPVQFYNSKNFESTTYFALNHRGYIHAATTGFYTFNISSVDDIALIWLGPEAYTGWLRTNAAEVAVYSSAIDFPGSGVYATTLSAGTYTPFRVLYGQAQGGAVFYMQITAPDGTVLLESNSPSSSSIVQYSCDGTTAPPFPAFGSE